jgi:hypothetical protein
MTTTTTQPGTLYIALELSQDKWLEQQRMAPPR